MSTVVYISYRRADHPEFNMDYYLNKHVPLFVKLWTPHGLKDWSIIQFEEDDKSGMSVPVACEVKTRRYMSSS